MARAGQEIVGHDGFRLRLLRTGADTDGELLEMEATYGGAGGMPPEHLHPHQDEHFEVLEGRVRVEVEGTELRYRAGEAFEILAGTRHRMAADGPAKVRWQVRPALRTAEFFERLYDEGESVGAVLAEFRAEIRITAP
jgi:quercetin dioxygenase-like cupin family protein